MRDLENSYVLKTYKAVTALLIVLMWGGLFVVFLRENNAGTGLFIHLGLVILLTFSLLIYPKKESLLIKGLIITFGTLYFHMLFYLYPETSSTFILICLIPAVSILYFDARLFYFSIIINGLLTGIIFVYVQFWDKGDLYNHLYMDLTGNIINFLGGQFLLALIFTLTKTRIKKQLLYYDQIRQAERLKTAGELAAAVAHEIRNPLTVVKGFLQFYQGDAALKPEMKDHLTLMTDELDRAEAVISDFLSISKPNIVSEDSIIDAKAEIESISDLLNSYAMMENIKIAPMLEKDCHIMINLMEFKQLLINLIKNAIEASPSGSTIEVETRKDNNQLLIDIIDYGCGMSPEELELIGTPFYSLKSKGTGLGMMLCFNIVQKYKGSIRIDSRKGNGTRVALSFPLVKDAAEKLSN